MNKLEQLEILTFRKSVVLLPQPICMSSASIYDVSSENGSIYMFVAQILPFSLLIGLTSTLSRASCIARGRSKIK